jgi:NAD(P)H-hydrate epimerase
MLNSFKDIGKRQEDTHKGDYGRVLVIAGSLGMSGAAYLCSQAAMISGCGLVELAAPKSINTILETKTTEVITYPQEETKEGTLNIKAFDSLMQLSQKADIVAIGCGLKNHTQVKNLVKKLIKNLDLPLVIDADAINSIADNVSLLKEAKRDIIITPHPGEMARLIKANTNAVQSERIKLAKRFSLKYNVITVLKGHQTVVVDKVGDEYVNTTGNPGMATAGAGDVLTGMIASFIAQGLKPFGAAKLGVYLHGLSGDIAASRKGQVSLIASDILECIPKAIEKI